MFTLTPAEERSRFISVDGEAIVLTAQHRRGKLAGLSAAIAVALFELFFTERIHLSQNGRGITLGAGREFPRPGALQAAAVVLLVAAVLELTATIRARTLLTDEGITQIAIQRRCVPWSRIDCVYRRTDRDRPRTLREVIWRPAIWHALVIEHDGGAHPLVGPIRRPEDIDMLADLTWRFRLERVGPWPRSTSGTDPYVGNRRPGLLLVAALLAQVLVIKGV